MLKTAKLFSDKMVLQQGKPIPIWGSAAPGSSVTVSFLDCTVQTLAGPDGNWHLKLPAQKAAIDQELTVISGPERIVYRDVCVGEVWLAGGQSNMEFLLGFEQHFDEVLAAELDPLIRFFDYPEVSYEGQTEDFSYQNHGFWRGCTQEDLPWFSAVGFFFAQELRKKCHVPVGIVGCNWGGTPASAWMDPKYLAGTPGEVWLQDYARTLETLDIPAYQEQFRHDPANDHTNPLAGQWGQMVMKDGLSRQAQLSIMGQYSAPPLVVGTYSERRPGGLYETMLKKIHPYSIRGVIWYQGETDGDAHPQVYDTVFSQMIRCWRDLWNEELPFLFAQLAPFDQWLHCDGKDYPIVRRCQDQVSRTVPNTWMASIGDVGMEWDIHPKNKKPVGIRLALLALGHVYGEDILCDAPEFRSLEKQGNSIRIRFANAQGLNIEGNCLNAFFGVTAEGEKIPLTDGFIDGDTLFVRCDTDIEEVQFAQQPFCKVNLYNSAGIPAKMFSARL